jgi:hypothetical protein
MDDVTLAVNYGNYRMVNAESSFITAKADSNGNYYRIATNGKKELGNEVDLTATYDYTEDVQIGLTAGWLMAGKGIETDVRDAQQLIGSMKVTF